nr:MAG TPA: hypothetical protein [Bacteriophage sp.]
MVVLARFLLLKYSKHSVLTVISQYKLKSLCGDFGLATIRSSSCKVLSILIISFSGICKTLISFFSIFIGFELLLLNSFISSWITFSLLFMFFAFLYQKVLE